MWTVGDLSDRELASYVKEVANDYTSGFQDEVLREAERRLRAYNGIPGKPHPGGVVV